jgi:hypothetical protein
MSYRGRIKDDEFRIGKGRKIADNFSFSRSWQKGYPSSRFSASYVSACYSVAPQAVFKIISYGSSKKSLGKLVEYLVERDEGRIEIEGSDGLIMEDSDISEMLDEWNVDFKDKGSGKGEQRHFTHMLLSANVDTTEVNYQKVLDTARQTAWQQFGQLGYEYKLVLHRDTDNPHVHIVLNNYNKVTNKKLRLDRHDLFTIRSNFADNLSKNDLKTHVSTLRKDRAESLHKVTSELEQLNKGIIDLNKLLVGCAYLKRNNKLDSVLNKQTGHNGLNADIKLDFDFSKGYLELSVKGVKNREVNSALQQIAYKQLNSKKFGLARDGSATLVARDVKRLTQQDQEMITADFDAIIQEKRDKRMVRQSRDGLGKYKYLLKQIDILVRKVRSNKQLSFKQKNESIEELGLIRKKIIDGFDLKDIEKGAQLAKSEAAIQVYKELDEIDARLRGKDYYNAEKSKALELKIDNLVQVGAKDKNYNFTNARVDVYPDKLKPNIFTLTLNKAQDKVFDAILVEVTKTIGSKKYKLKRNTGTSAIVISDKELTPELKKKIEFISKTILNREEKLQNKFNEYKKEGVFIKKQPTRLEFLHRKRALEKYATRHTAEIKGAIKIFRKNKDSDTVKLLEGMLKKSAYKDIIESHKGVQKSVIKNKGMGELK